MPLECSGNWQSTSMYLVCSWKAGFVAIWIALVLSAWRGIEVAWEKPCSARRECSQTTSEHVDDLELYSTSVENLETRSFSLHFHEVSALPKKTPTHCGMPGVWTADPICITVSRNMYLVSLRKETASFYSTKVIEDDPLDSAKMEMCGLGRKLTDKLVWPHERYRAE